MDAMAKLGARQFGAVRDDLAEAAVLATSHSTGTGTSGMLPCGAIGSGARRVQMTKPSLAGSPAATPRLNGKSRKEAGLGAQYGRGGQSGKRGGGKEIAAREHGGTPGGETNRAPSCDS